MKSIAPNLAGVIDQLLSLAKIEAVEAWHKANHKKLVEVYGSPCRMTRTKEGFKLAGINECYWAGAWSLHNLGLYDHLDEIFYRYEASSGLWLSVTEDALKQEIAALILHASRTYPHSKGLEHYRGDSEQSAVVRQLRGQLEQRNPFANRRKIVHLANCCLIIEGGGHKLCGYSSEFKSRNRSPIAYCPGASCPRFLDELLKPNVHPEDVEIIQKYMGQCLLGTNPTARMLVMDGPGKRGKSQIATIIRGITGAENCYELRTEQLTGRFEMYRYIGKSLLIGSDVQPNFLNVKGASELKKLSGGDPLNPEKKNGNGIFELKGAFNFVITSNSRLGLRLIGDESAWRRRITIVRFEGPEPNKKVADFGEYLLANEGSGILNWALEGLKKLLAEIEIDNDFVLTSRQKQIIDDLIDESQSLRIFLETCVKSEAGSHATTQELTRAYVRFCETRGWERGLRSATIIARQLGDLMMELFHSSNSHDLGGRGYRGVRIVSAFTGEDCASHAALRLEQPSIELPHECKAESSTIGVVPRLKRTNQSAEQILAEGLCPWLDYRREDLISRATSAGISRPAAMKAFAKLVDDKTFDEVGNDVVRISPC